MQDERLRRDVMPAEVALADGTVLGARGHKVRLFVTSHRVVAWRDINGSIEQVLDVPLAEPWSVEAHRGTLPGTLEVETADGTAYVSRGYGCGCGSALLALAPPVSWTG